MNAVGEREGMDKEVGSIAGAVTVGGTVATEVIVGVGSSLPGMIKVMNL